MPLLYLFITLIFFDLNIGMANSGSRVVFIGVLLCLLISKRGKIIISKIAIFQAIILVMLIISVTINHGSWKDIVLIAEQLLIYITIYNFVDSDNKAIGVLKWTAIVGLCLAGLGIIEYLFFEQFQPLLIRFRTIETGLYYESGYGRISSTFINPIFFSVILVVTIFISQAFNRIEKRILWKIVWITSVVALLLTRSEGGILAFVLVEILLNLKIIRNFFIKYSIVWKLVVIFGVVAVLLYAFTSGIDRKFLVSIFTARVYAWTASIRIFAHNILLGCGLGNFDSSFRLYAYEFIKGYYFTKYAPHSDFFSMLANGGLLTVFPFIGMVIYEIKISCLSLLGIDTIGDRKKIIIVACAFTIIYFSVHRIIDDFYYSYRVITLVNMLIAILERLYDGRMISMENGQSLFKERIR